MKITIIYDGLCPVCQRLALGTRLRKSGSQLTLLNARNQDVQDVQGCDLSSADFDQGFAVVIDGHVHYGAEAAHVLNLITEPSGIGFRLFSWLTRSPESSQFWYPILRRCRVLLLRLLGIPKFSA